MIISTFIFCKCLCKDLSKLALNPFHQFYKLTAAVVKPGKEHAGATLEVPSEEIIRKSGEGQERRG